MCVCGLCERVCGCRCGCEAQGVGRGRLGLATWGFDCGLGLYAGAGGVGSLPVATWRVCHPRLPCPSLARPALLHAPRPGCSFCPVLRCCTPSVQRPTLRPALPRAALPHAGVVPLYNHLCPAALPCTASPHSCTATIRLPIPPINDRCPVRCPVLYCLVPQLYSHAGVPATGFQGVPLFQAEGLTIRGEKERYTPLFFRCAAVQPEGPARALAPPVLRARPTSRPCPASLPCSCPAPALLPAPACLPARLPARLLCHRPAYLSHPAQPCSVLPGPA